LSATKKLDGDLRRRLAQVRLLSLDVDGVQTDGGVYVDEAGQVTRRFHVHDGVGIQRVMRAGIEIVMISAGRSSSIEHRADRLGVKYVFTAVQDKLVTLGNLAEDLEIPLEQVVHVGDDLNDLPLLQAVGCPMTVPNGMPELKDAACYVTMRSGGDGAVREICDLLLTARDDG